MRRDGAPICAKKGLAWRRWASASRPHRIFKLNDGPVFRYWRRAQPSPRNTIIDETFATKIPDKHPIRTSLACSVARCRPGVGVGALYGQGRTRFDGRLCSAWAASVLNVVRWRHDWRRASKIIGVDANPAKEGIARNSVSLISSTRAKTDDVTRWLSKI